MQLFTCDIVSSIIRLMRDFIYILGTLSHVFLFFARERRIMYEEFSVVASFYVCYMQ